MSCAPSISDDDNDSLQVVHDRAGPRLVIVCGLPGSGKTTLATELEDRLGAVRFSPDEWMAALTIDLYDEDKRANIEALQWDIARRLIALGQVVIIEWGTWGRAERDVLREGARALGAAVELHYLTAPPDILFDRIRRRGLENPPAKLVSSLRGADGSGNGALRSPLPIGFLIGL